MKPLSRVLFSIFTVLAAGPVSAVIIHTETHVITPSSPTALYNVGYNNPEGQAHYFKYTTFVPTGFSGTATFTFADTSNTLAGGSHDTVGGIYDSTFTPADLAVGWLAGGDDSPANSGLSNGFTFDVDLTAGQRYTLVTSAFDALTTGSITWQVDGPSGSTLVPEPQTYAMIAGLALLGFASFHRLKCRKILTT